MQALHSSLGQCRARGGLASTSSASARSCIAPRPGGRCPRSQALRRVRQSVTVRAASAATYVDAFDAYEREVLRQRLHQLKLVLPKAEHRTQLLSTVQDYYSCWNCGTADGLDDMVQDGVVYADVLRCDSDFFGRSSLKQLVTEFTASHPLLHFEVEDVIVDADRDTAVAHWTATSADLLPHADGSPASGRVSEIHGMDRFKFDGDSMKIKAIASYRDRFEDEDATPVDWSEE